MKIPKDQIIQSQIDNNIWVDDEVSWWMDEYREDYWDGVHNGEMSWQWYMALSFVRDKGWQYVIISDDHKNTTVINWLKENYPECGFKYEKNHFLIELEQVATIVALKFS